MIRLLTFDLDNTLWETESVVAAAELTLLDWLKGNAPLFVERLDADARRHLREEVLATDPDLRHRVTALRIAILELGLQKAGYPTDQVKELAQRGFDVFLEARHAVTFFPHVENLLQQLAQQYQLATISNGNADVRRLGLEKYFSIIIAADEIGRSKPDPAPFLAALERAAAEPHETLHVGDHPVDDVQGAQAVGLHTLWLNRLGLPWPDQPRPHGEVRCLSEIPTWLQHYTLDPDALRPER